MSKMVILMSGGLKSAVAAARVAREAELWLAHVNHGQPSFGAEREAIQRLMPTYPNACYLEIPLPPFTLDDRPVQRSGRTNLNADNAVAPTRGHAPDERAHDQTNRNEPLDHSSPATTRGLFPVLCSLAVQCALRAGARTVITGLNDDGPATHLGLTVQGSTSPIRGSLIHALNGVSELVGPQKRPIRIEVPLIGLATHEVVKLAEHLGVPPASTWTCLQTGPKPCRRCAPCQARAAAFQRCLSPDPLLRAREHSSLTNTR